MQTRLRLYRVAGALLYIGPFLAGLTGIGWAAAPLFVALFVPGRMLLHPLVQQRDRIERLILQLVMAVLIAVALFGAGRAIGGVAGFVAHIPAIVPLGLGALALFAAYAGSPARAQAAKPVFPGVAPRPVADTGDAMVGALLALPGDCDPMLTADAVEVAIAGRAAAARLQALADGLGTRVGHRALREAVILWATDPARHPDEGFGGAQAAAFRIAGADAVLLHLFAHRGAALLAQHPRLWPDFPQVGQVDMAVTRDMPDNLQAALFALSRSLDAAKAAVVGR